MACLTDGDEAGRKYAATATHYANKINSSDRDRLTMLPTRYGTFPIS